MVAGMTAGRRRVEANVAMSALPLSQQLHVISGAVLMLSVPLHIVATRLRSLVQGSAYLADFSLVTYVTHPLHKFLKYHHQQVILTPIYELRWSLELAPYWYYPYYMALGAAGIYHFMNGLIKGMSTLGQISPLKAYKFTSSSFWWLLAGAGTGLMLSSVLAFGRDVDRSRYPEFEADTAWVISLVDPRNWFGSR
jgi:succinate dehydrogenase/fumarate reductase cytochrome b subunit